MFPLFMIATAVEVLYRTPTSTTAEVRQTIAYESKTVIIF